jgi:phenylalanyl-tRNA synthetase beta subunit
VKIVLPWLAEIVSVPSDVEQVARAIALRGFEVASIETRSLPAIDFEITANRPDCMCHLGIAREAATIWEHPLQQPEMLTASPETESYGLLDVRLEDGRLWRRESGRSATSWTSRTT